MATMVRFQEVFSHDGSLWFRTLDNEVLSVKALNDGVMVIDPMIGTNIQKTAAIVAGCFDEESNLNGLKAIEFDFNGVYISVNAKNAQVDTILKMFEDGWQKNCEEAEANGISESGKFNYIKADLDYIPKHGFYRYKTSPVMTGEWIIAGEMKVIKILSDQEVKENCDSCGSDYLPRKETINLSEFGFAA